MVVEEEFYGTIMVVAVVVNMVAVVVVATMVVSGSGYGGRTVHLLYPSVPILHTFSSYTSHISTNPLFLFSLIRKI